MLARLHEKSKRVPSIRRPVSTKKRCWRSRFAFVAIPGRSVAYAGAKGLGVSSRTEMREVVQVQAARQCSGLAGEHMQQSQSATDCRAWLCVSKAMISIADFFSVYGCLGVLVLCFSSSGYLLLVYSNLKRDCLLVKSFADESVFF